MARTLILLAGLTALACQASRVTQGTSDELFPLADAVVEQDGERYWVFRVTDELGRSLPDAVAYTTYEKEAPEGGEFWYSSRADADGDGFVRLPCPEDVDLVHVTAPGFAPYTETSPWGAVVRLQPGLDLPIALVDWMGRPIPGAEIGITRYCGHRPDLAVAVTGPDGIARFPDTRGDGQEVYPRAHGYGMDYVDLESWRPGQPPQSLQLFESPEVMGVVLDAEGRPLPGVPVGGAGQHRGPWTHTDSDGKFRLSFLPPYDDLEIRGELFEWYFFPLPPRGVPATLRLPDEPPEAWPMGLLRVRVVDEAGEPVRDTPLFFLHMGEHTTDAEGYASFETKAGERTLQAGAGPCAYESDEVPVRIEAEGETSVVLLVRERPRLGFRIEGDPGSLVYGVELGQARDARSAMPSRGGPGSWRSFAGAPGPGW